MTAALVGGCTSHRKHPSATTAPATTLAPVVLKVDVRASAEGGAPGAAKGATAKATPGMRRFLTTYLTDAFLDPNQRQKAYQDLLGLFDATVQASAKRDLPALSLADEAAGLHDVRPTSAKAAVTFLLQGRDVVAATAHVVFDGTAVGGQGKGSIKATADLQLLAAGSGWRIVGYDAHTGPPA